MTNLERNAISRVEKRMPIIAAVIFTLIKAFIVWKTWEFISGDMRDALYPWFNVIKNCGGFASLCEQVGDYGILYQTIIAIMTYIPLVPVFSYKLLSVLIDFALGVAGGTLIWEIQGRTKEALRNAVITYSVIIVSPIVVMNSAVWGQCDCIFTFFIIMSLIFLWREKNIASFIMLGVAFALKLQAIFIVPFFVIWYFKAKKFSIANVLLIPVTMIVTNIPGLIYGRKVIDVFAVFFNQIGGYSFVSANCFNLGSLLVDDHENYSIISPIMLTVCILYLFLLFMTVIKSTRPLSAQYMLEIAFISSYGCFMLLPGMHERYGYLAEVLGVLLAITNRKTIPLLLPMLCLTSITYGIYLFDQTVINYTIFSLINLVIFMLYNVLLFKDTEKLHPEENPSVKTEQ